MNPSMMFVNLYQPTSKTGRWLLIIEVLVLLVLIAGTAFFLLHPLAPQTGGLLAATTGNVHVGNGG